MAIFNKKICGGTLKGSSGTLWCLISFLYHYNVIFFFSFFCFFVYRKTNQNALRSVCFQIIKLNHVKHVESLQCDRGDFKLMIQKQRFAHLVQLVHLYTKQVNLLSHLESFFILKRIIFLLISLYSSQLHHSFHVEAIFFNIIFILI